MAAAAWSSGSVPGRLQRPSLPTPAPIAPELGEFRAHYAGFFDPGFGVTHTKGKAVLEVRSRDVPFILEDGQPVGRLVFEKLTAKPAVPYGAEGSFSTYHGQGLRLSKYFEATGE